MSPSFPRHFQGTVLRDSPLVPCRLAPTGLSPSAAPHSRGLRLRRRGVGEGPATPHPPALSGRGSVCPLPFSVAPTHGIPFWFLFLRVIRCFSSPGSRSRRSARAQRPCRRPHSGILGSTAPCAYPRPIAAWHALRRLPSLAIHRPASGARPAFAPPPRPHRP